MTRRWTDRNAELTPQQRAVVDRVRWSNLFPKSLPTEVYFLQCGEFVKIGIASRVQDRVRIIHSCSPHKMELLHVEPGGLKRERELHAEFAAYRHRDEWFIIAGRLAEYLASVRQ